MATRFIEGVDPTSDLTISQAVEALADMVGPHQTPLVYNQDDGVLNAWDKVNDALRPIVSTTATQTLTNKTLMSPYIATLTITGAPTPLSVTGAATFGATHVNRITVLNAVAGGQIDLPAATGTGNVYYAIVGTALTSASWVFRTAVASGDRFTGGVTINDTGDTAAETADFYPAGASDEVLTLAFAATLGTIGAWVEFTDFKTGLFNVRGHLGSSIDPATPWGVATT